jgi:hypothetical protein
MSTHRLQENDAGGDDLATLGGECSGLEVRLHVRLARGEAGRALAAAQGRALAALLASLADPEVGQGEEVSP